MKIIHISDIHILNYRFHSEYKIVFDELYQHIKRIKPDLIINTGDTAHTKLAISPSWVEMAGDFCKNLADLCELVIIPGNHDLNAKNPEKTDAITPVVNLLKGKTKFPIHFFKETQTFEKDNFCFHVLSFLEPEKWQEPQSQDKINVALYHGGVFGALTDAGYVISHGEIKLDFLKKFDYGLLGDIHHSQKLDEKGKIRYAGNLVQFNFGENNDKGFLSWDIKSKDDFTCEKIIIKNPKPFETVELNQFGEPKSFFTPSENSRLRVIYDSTTPLTMVNSFVDMAKKTHKLDSVVRLPRFDANNSNPYGYSTKIQENFRDLNTQEDFIKDFLKKSEIDEQKIAKVLELNSKIEQECLKNEVFGNSVRWELEKLEWSNLFSFGENNYIDFSNLGGIIGQFSNNGEGKSATWDVLCLCIFNTTAKNERKNLYVINVDKDKAFCKATINIGEEKYIIERTFQKVKNNKDSVDVRVDVSFKKIVDGIEEILNGESRSDTDKNIRSIFGTVDDFMLTAYSTQMDSFKFINEGWTKRKEILGRFLDLDFFDKKFQSAKEDAKTKKILLKKYENVDFIELIKKETEEIKKLSEEIEKNNEKCSTLKKEQEELQEKITKNKILIGTTKKVVSIENLEEEKYEIESNIANKKYEIEKFLNENALNKEKISDLNEKILDLSDINKLIFNLEKKKSEKKQFETEFLNKKELKERLEKNVGILDKIPCGEQYPECLFISEAVKSKQESKLLKEQLEIEQEKRKNLEEEISKIDTSEIQKKIEQKKDFEKQVAILQSKINQNLTKITVNESQIPLLNEKLILKSKEVDEAKQSEDKKNLFVELDSFQESLDKLNKDLSICDKKSSELYVSLGVSKKTFDGLKEQLEEKNKLSDEYLIYELFLRCMHPNGIPFEIIKSNLSIINREINSILSNCVDFQVYLDVDEKQLNILYERNGKPLIIEISGGAQKTLASFAVRLALISISKLPVPDIMILDEPATAFDSENLEGFSSTLEMIKSKFKNVILISHINSLKDVADKFITMSKVDGYTLIQQT